MNEFLTYVFLGGKTFFSLLFNPQFKKYIIIILHYFHVYFLLIFCILVKILKLVTHIHAIYLNFIWVDFLLLFIMQIWIFDVFTYLAVSYLSAIIFIISVYFSFYLVSYFTASIFFFLILFRIQNRHFLKIL